MPLAAPKGPSSASPEGPRSTSLLIGLRRRRRRLALVAFASALGTIAYSLWHAESPSAKPDKTSALLLGADGIATTVARMRKLAAKAPLAKGVVTREQVRARMGQRIREIYKPEEVKAEGRMLERLGLLPRGADYEALITKLLMEQVAGFYDPFAKKLFIADWVPGPAQRPAMAHEIAHGLVDQHFDLKRISEPQKGESDRQLANAALVEGDGTLLMLQFAFSSQGILGPNDAFPEPMPDLRAILRSNLKSVSAGPVFDQAPAFLKESLLFPYIEGLGLVQHVYRAGGWAAVDRMYRDLPQSTEQVLHPEKYADKRDPPVVILDRPIEALEKLGWRRLHRDVMGEFQLRTWLKLTGVPETEAATAAAGWGGDRVVSYVSPAGKVCVLMKTVWDEPRDASEFAASARYAVNRLSHGDGTRVEHSDRDVVVLLGLPPALLKTVARSVGEWATQTR